MKIVNYSLANIFNDYVYTLFVYLKYYKKTLGLKIKNKYIKIDIYINST